MILKITSLLASRDAFLHGCLPFNSFYEAIITCIAASEDHYRLRDPLCVGGRSQKCNVAQSISLNRGGESFTVSWRNPYVKRTRKNFPTKERWLSERGGRGDVKRRAGRLDCPWESLSFANQFLPKRNARGMRHDSRDQCVFRADVSSLVWTAFVWWYSRIM